MSFMSSAVYGGVKSLSDGYAPAKVLRCLRGGFFSTRRKTEMANKANINALIKTLNTIPDHKFCMAYYLTDTVDKLGKHCGTAGCIAGWAAMLATNANPKKYDDEVRDHIEDKSYNVRLSSEQDRIYNDMGPIPAMAAKWLNIDYVTAGNLFSPESPVQIDQVTNKDAVKMLRILRDKGEVTMADWKRVLKG